jgi:hypothetical protein
MVAENKIGELLEEYIANTMEPQGWFWCCTDIFVGVDFFLAGDPVTLLQVKNRDNSENSSSSRIRKQLLAMGCPVEIAKWYRSKSRSVNTCWDKFPGNEQMQFMDEERFLAFIRNYPVHK